MFDVIEIRFGVLFDFVWREVGYTRRSRMGKRRKISFLGGFSTTMNHGGEGVEGCTRMGLDQTGVMR